MNKAKLAGALKGIDVLLEGTAHTLEKIGYPLFELDIKHIEAVLTTAKSIPGLLALKEYYESELDKLQQGQFQSNYLFRLL